MVADQMLTIDQVAERLGVGRSAVYTRVAAGELDVHNVGSVRRPRLRVSESDLAAFEARVRMSRPTRRRSAA